MTSQQHLDRGSCCSRGCVYCPYRLPVVHKPLNIDPAIEAALRSGDAITIYSDRMSLVPIVKMQNLTIIYKEYQP